MAHLTGPKKRLHYRVPLRYYKGTTGSVDSASCCRNVKHPSEVCCTKWRNTVITSALGMVSVRAKVILPSLSPSPPHRIIRNVLKMHENQRKLSTYLRHCPEFAQLPCLAEHAQQSVHWYLQRFRHCIQHIAAGRLKFVEHEELS